jgi:hypothetical protein
MAEEIVKTAHVPVSFSKSRIDRQLDIEFDGLAVKT